MAKENEWARVIQSYSMVKTIWGKTLFSSSSLIFSALHWLRFHTSCLHVVLKMALEGPGFLETLWLCDIGGYNYAFARLLHSSFKGDFDWLALITLPSSNQCLPGRWVHGIGRAWFTRLSLKGRMTNSRDKSGRGGPSKVMSRPSK